VRSRELGWAELIQPRGLFALTIVIGVLSLLAGQGTLAYFTSTATSTGNVFTTGTVVLRLTDANESAAAAVSASFGTSAFRPGDTVAGYITVANTGTLPLDYGLRYTATNTSGTLWVAGATNPTLEVYTAGATGNCTSANAAGAKTGLTSVSGAASVSTSANTVLFDSAGGTKRTLAASANEILCFVVVWPNGAAGAENAQMGSSGNIDLAFDAR
jgi:predicted ribosomally synthesized peptide with SipW-like signal peptide